MKDGTRAKLPWYIEISSGRGKKEKNATGGYYMKGGTYKEVSKCYARLSDGHMKEHVFWGEQFMQIFANAAKKRVIEGYTALIKQIESLKRAKT